MGGGLKIHLDGFVGRVKEGWEVEAQTGLYFLRDDRLHRAAGVMGIWEDNRVIGSRRFVIQLYSK